MMMKVATLGVRWCVVCDQAAAADRWGTHTVPVDSTRVDLCVLLLLLLLFLLLLLQH